jgi:UDP-GlcNAc3NAcA epimerase
MSQLKILSVVGARPQIIKASAISRAVRRAYSDRIKEVIIHTGQHYDKDMSEVFFDELEIHKPDFNLGVGSGSHGKQTASMISGIEQILLSQNPDCVIIYGDTNSTLAGAIAASKIHFPLIHIEAGLRSFNKRMPEEINRIMSDHASTLLFAPTNTAFGNLMKEGFRPENSPPFTIDNPKIYLTGDIMYDNALYFAGLALNKKPEFLHQLGLQKGEFVLVTIHRDMNTDNLDRLHRIINTLISLAESHSIKMVLPLHPRTTKIFLNNSPELYNELITNKNIVVIPPVSYLEMILLEKNSSLVITDSGGVQKESHFFSKPCLVLRKETEWTELVKNGTAALVDADPDKIIFSFNEFINAGSKLQYPGFYGDGKAAEFILEEIIRLFSKE